MQGYKHFYFWFLLIFLTMFGVMFGWFVHAIHGYAQVSPYLDRAPTGQENVRMTQRGPQKVPIERNVPLEELIQRLEGEWEMVETGKAYYIGYTDDMYSIAAYKDAAIEPLLQFIQHTSSLWAKHGTVWTLHLIGINSKIAGRFYEEFVNPHARNALLQLLSDEELRDHIMSLLMKDPWPSDVPVVIAMLKKSERKVEPLTKGLLRYPFIEMPFRQPIRNETKHIEVILLDPEILSTPMILGKLEHMSFDEVPQGGMISEFVVQHASSYNQWTSRFWQWTPLDLYHIQELSDKYNITIKEHLQHLLNGGLSSPNYYLEGTTMYLCAPSVAKQRWLDWYSDQVAHGGPQFETPEKTDNE